MPIFEAIKASMKEVEKKLKKCRLNRITGFATVRKEFKRLLKLVLGRQRKNANPVTARLQYRFCLRRL